MLQKMECEQNYNKKFLEKQRLEQIEFNRAKSTDEVLLLILAEL